MHPSFDPVTMRRRQFELTKAETAFDVAQLQVKWQSEDAAAADAQDHRVKEVTELRARVAALERRLGGFAKATGDALREIREQDRAHLLSEVAKCGFVRYGGVWDAAADYARGAMVTHAGSTWIATGPCEKGARPGKAAEWRLAVKSADTMPGVA
jgi:hypothetical protein